MRPAVQPTHTGLCFAMAWPGWHALARAVTAWLLAGAAQAHPIAPLELNRADARLAPASVGRHVDLPHAWHQEDPPWQGVTRYTLKVPLPATDTQALSEPWALYIPRAGNRFAVWLNDRYVGDTGDLDNTREDHVHTPHYFSLPAGTLHTGENALVLEVHGEKARHAGLGRVWIGPAATLRPMSLQRSALDQGSALVMSSLSLVAGVLSLGFGLVMGARAQTLFGVGALLWAARSTHVLVTRAPLGHPWWNILIDMLYGLAVLLLCTSALKTLRVVSAGWRATGQWLLLSSLVLPVLYGLSGVWLWRQALFVLVVLGVSHCTVLVLHRWWTRPDTESTVIGGAALLATALGVFDHVRIMWLPAGYSDLALSRLSFLFILLAMSALLMRRILRNLNAARRFRQRLQLRLSRTRAELTRLYEARERDRVQEAELSERIRILGDLHDGVGAHLVAMQSLLSLPQVNTQALAHEVVQAGLALREGLNTLQGTPQSWTSSLASWRDTLEARLQHAHIALVWEVGQEPALPPPNINDYQQLRLLLSELITNVIKHAQARQVRIRTRTVSADGTVWWTLEVHDNGRGLPGARVPGRGFTTLHMRAQALRAQVQVDSPGQGTVVRLSWSIGTTRPGDAPRPVRETGSPAPP